MERLVIPLRDTVLPFRASLLLCSVANMQQVSEKGKKKAGRVAHRKRENVCDGMFVVKSEDVYLSVLTFGFAFCRLYFFAPKDGCTAT